MKKHQYLLAPVTFAVLTALAPMTSSAGDDIESLKRTVEMLQKQLEEVQKKLNQQAETSVTREEVQQIQKNVATASEWRTPDTLVHMAGYAGVGYEKKTQGNDDNGSFRVASFSPIFHFQYRDLVMLESELEFEVEDDGATNTNLEYLTIDLLMNDYAALVAGKFLSPVGQFRQNLHPSWINKMASAPPGFGHDGAAPVSDVGVQLRGGYPFGSVRTNYAVYASNGPELVAATEDGIEFGLEGIDAEGFNSDADGQKVMGGRLGVLPMDGLEIGVSGATGEAVVTKYEDETTGDTIVVGSQGKRDYDVFGADFNYQYRSLGLRGEYVKTKVGSTGKGLTASGGANWSTWYTQAAYRFLPTRWEAVLRYTDFDSAVRSQDQQQLGLGLNYLFANNVIAKINYEFNDGKNGSPVGDNRLVGQLAYGF